jgi:release factor glutamine methyltransferase
MKNSKDLFTLLRNSITVYDAEEAESIAFVILDHLYALTRTDVLIEKTMSLSPEQDVLLRSIVSRINAHEPVQYVLESAYFFGRDFYVSPAVLIPRPETELLVEEVIKTTGDTPVNILDIGTGSGCIAISLAKELPNATVTALDINKDALDVARKNATQLNAHIQFLQSDILTEAIAVKNLDVIVSNPPYIAYPEKETMRENVLAYEPHVALFVPDTDALIFYNTIAQKGFAALNADGKIFVEINERFGKETADTFIQAGFSTVKIIQDLQGKDRIVVATKHYSLKEPDSGFVSPPHD